MAGADKAIKTLNKVFTIKGEIDNLLKIPKAGELGMKARATGQLHATVVK